MDMVAVEWDPIHFQSGCDLCCDARLVDREISSSLPFPKLKHPSFGRGPSKCGGNFSISVDFIKTADNVLKATWTQTFHTYDSISTNISGVAVTFKTARMMVTRRDPRP